MDDEQNIDRDELLERFRQSIALPLTDRYFDEDELIDIFDAAGDTEDDLVRMEVLSVASRFYPDSDELNQRRGLFYGTISDAAGAQFLEANADKDSPMWRLMRLKQKRGLPDVNFTVELDDFVNSVDKFEDEEVVIQLIRFVAELNMADWLSKNIGKLSRRCPNKLVVLYEGATAFETMHRHEAAAKLLTELTDLDPFGYSNWVMLAEQYLVLGNEQEFNNAIDYALALNPDYWEGLFVKGKFEFYKENFTKASELFGRCCRADVLVPEVYRLYAYALRGAGDVARAEQVCRESLTLFPHEVLNIIPELLMFSPADARELFDLFYRNNGENSEAFWRSWINRLWDTSFFDMAVIACYSYRANSGFYPLTLVPAEYGLRFNRNYEETLRWVDAYINGCTEAGEYIESGQCALIRVITLARMNKRNEALSLGIEYLCQPQPEGPLTMTRRMVENDVRRIIKQVVATLTANPHADFTDLTPFGL